ncbi:hypothetical protein [Pseudodonghicola flavimaris]|uniref:Anti-bacteriophage protein A/HamA C-terminal domain-containing protein n=1 Tax=Pseudodonghicola flavimaris TaxID=3050036 RepID=A0ABT7EXN0_9RHOB|nr:hypothetical protein [Pseudodonghicola flavimaris]MDK3017030.1 hypothetical protein [Pseudodonghicola flavimaris]
MKIDEVGLSGPLVCEACPIDGDCTGERWTTANDAELAALVAIVAMGQASQAAHILEELVSPVPAFSMQTLRQEAKVKLTVEEPASKPRKGYPQWQRDGFVFEVISWIAAKTTHGEGALLKDPHVSATSQGLDGLMLQLNADKDEVTSTTVFEDKCTDDPRSTFLGKVIPAFKDRHANIRSAEIIDAAATLLRTAGLKHSNAARLSAAVTDLTRRKYRAAFSLPSNFDTLEERQKLFADYDRIEHIASEQRIGASFITSDEMRKWIADLADKAIHYLDSLEDGECTNV